MKDITLTNNEKEEVILKVFDIYIGKKNRFSSEEEKHSYYEEYIKILNDTQKAQINSAINRQLNIKKKLKKERLTMKKVKISMILGATIVTIITSLGALSLKNTKLVREQPTYTIENTIDLDLENIREMYQENYEERTTEKPVQEEMEAPEIEVKDAVFSYDVARTTYFYPGDECLTTTQTASGNYIGSTMSPTMMKELPIDGGLCVVDNEIMYKDHEYGLVNVFAVKSSIYQEFQGSIACLKYPNGDEKTGIILDICGKDNRTVENYVDVFLFSQPDDIKAYDRDYRNSTQKINFAIVDVREKLPYPGPTREEVLVQENKVIGNDSYENSKENVLNVNTFLNNFNNMTPVLFKDINGHTFTTSYQKNEIEKVNQK